MENKMTNMKKFWSIFWWTIRRYIPVSIAYWALLFLAVPFAQVFEGILTSATYSLENNGKFSVDLNTYREVLQETAYYTVGVEMGFLVVLFSIIIGISAFSYMHKKRSVDFFGSLPVSRTTMFFSRLSAVVALIIVPAIVMGALGAATTLSWTAALDVFEVLGYVVLTAVGNIVFIAFISLCCGNSTDVLVSYLAVNIAYPICVALFNAFPQVVIPGIESSVMSGNVYTMFCPVASVFTITFGKEKLFGIIWWIIITIVLLVGSYILSKKRKAEIAQNTYILSVVEYTVKLIVCTISGLGLGWGFAYSGLAFQSITAQYILFALGLIIGVMVSNLLLHLIYHRGFSKYAKSLIGCLASAIICSTYVVIVATGFFGSDTYIPQLDEIEAVSIKNGYEETFYVNGIDVLCKYETDEDSINTTYDIHNAIIENNKNEYKKTGLYPLTGIGAYGASIDIFDYYGDDITITYRLKDGSVVERNYTYSEVDADITIEEAYEEEVNYEEPDYINLIPSKYSCGFTIYAGNSVESSYSIYANRNTSNIVEALKKDIATVGKVKKKDATFIIEVEYEDEEYTYVYDRIKCNESYVNTLEALKVAGYENLELEALKQVWNISEGYEVEEAGTIYFNLPEGMDPNKDIVCLQGYNYYYYEYIYPIDSDKAKCEKVDDNTWKYTYYKVDDEYYEESKKTFTFCQINDDSIVTTGIIKMPKNKEVDTLTIGDRLLDDDGNPITESFDVVMYNYEWSDSTEN